MKSYLLAAAVLLHPCAAFADPEADAGPSSVSGWFATRIPITNRGASTFYIEGHIEGLGSASLLVDTGSGYTAMDQESISKLVNHGRARYVRKLRGVMADGSKKIMPVYRIHGIRLGQVCFVGDIEVAVFPRKTRMILGLNALRKLAPFAFALEGEPQLMLSNCQLPAADIAQNPSSQGELAQLEPNMVVSANGDE